MFDPIMMTQMHAAEFQRCFAIADFAPATTIGVRFEAEIQHKQANVIRRRAEGLKSFHGLQPSHELLVDILRRHIRSRNVRITLMSITPPNDHRPTSRRRDSLRDTDDGIACGVARPRHGDVHRASGPRHAAWRIVSHTALAP